MEQKRGDEIMDYTRLREKIREMQDEIIGGIQDCIRIDSVGGEPEEGAPYGKGPKEAGGMGCKSQRSGAAVSGGGKHRDP